MIFFSVLTKRFRMKNKKKYAGYIKQLCSQAIERVDIAIEKHKKGEPADLNISMLLKVRNELVKMQSATDKSKYSPTYGRFILDWPDEYGLINYLLGVSYEYKKRT